MKKIIQQHSLPLNVHTEWAPLKEIIVGNVVNTSETRDVDLSYKLFYHKNINHEILEHSIPLQKKLIEQREEDLNSLSETLTKLGIIVHRPDKLSAVTKVQTPNFESYTKPSDNPRDLALIVGNKIIETPVLCRNRFYELDLLKKIFYQKFMSGAHWISAPRPTLNEGSFDFSYVKQKNDSAKEEIVSEYSPGLEIMFDAAQCLKFGKSIIMNISTKNHYLGYKWLSSILGNDYKIIPVYITDHHLDGMMMPLAPGKLLISEAMRGKKHLLPASLQKWDIIEFENFNVTTDGQEKTFLASQNICANVLPLSEKLVMVFSADGKPPVPLVNALEKNGLEAITVKLRHSRVFDGGLHCATLDLVRSDDAIDYL
jgi:glycine amidinotransferase